MSEFKCNECGHEFSKKEAEKVKVSDDASRFSCPNCEEEINENIRIPTADIQLI